MKLSNKWRSGQIPAAIWFFALGLIVLGPLLAPGYLLLLDFPAGPDSPWPSLLPLPSEGLVNASAPFALLVRSVGSLSPELPNKLLVLLVIITGGFGLFRFLVSFLRLPAPAALVAGTFFVINPFFYERLLAGHVFFALGCAMLPWALRSLAETCTGTQGLPALKAAAWTGGISLVDVHVGGMAALLLFLAIWLSPRPWTARLALTGTGIGAVIALNLFWILPSFLAAEAGRLGAGDLLAYAPRPRSETILPHVLMLHGFWRTEFTTPLKTNAGLFLLGFLPLFALAVFGVVRAMRFDRWRRASAALGIAALVAIVLGMGTSFPATRRLTEFLFESVPGYGIYREPQKWIALLVLAYAVFAAVGLQAVAGHFRSRSNAILAAALLPLLAAPMAMWGFGAQAQVSEFPSDWAKARELIADRDGNLLFLPWNLYQPIPFADNRTVANPGDHYFGSRALTSGDAALSRRHTTAPADPRDEYVYTLVRNGYRINSFGHLVAPLGVRFVALANIADAPDYGWLKRQEDLRPILEGDDLTLYESTAWRGDVYGLDNGSQTTLDRLLNGTSEEPSAATHLRVTNGDATDPLGGPALVRSAPGWKEVGPPAAGMVGTEGSCGDGWRLGDEKPVCHLGALAVFKSPNDTARLWRPGVFWQILGIFLSTIAALILWELVRRGRRHPSARQGRSRASH